MIYIILGCILFLAVHLLSLFPARRAYLIEKYGVKKYKGSYSLVALLGLVLIFTARFNGGDYVKDASLAFYEYRFALIYVSLLFIVAAEVPNNYIKKFSKHPMLIGISLWSFTHFMLNQHLNHLVLFLFFFIFSLIMLVGAIIKERKVKSVIPASAKGTALTLIVTTIVFTVITYFHGFIAGIDLI